MRPKLWSKKRTPRSEGLYGSCSRDTGGNQDLLAMELTIHSLIANAPAHADPVVPILLAIVFLTLAAVFGGRLMTWLKQPPVLGELLAGVFIGNFAYWL